MTNEIWKDIPGFEGYYQASTLGRIKTIRSIKSKGGQPSNRILSRCINTWGYQSVALCVDGRAKTRKVSRLILLTFKGASDLDVDHINGIKSDDRLMNLRYCTTRQNVHYSYIKTKHKRASKYIGVYKNGNRKKPWRAMIMINGKLNFIGSFATEWGARLGYLKKLKSVVINDK